MSETKGEPILEIGPKIPPHIPPHITNRPNNLLHLKTPDLLHRLGFVRQCMEACL